MSACPDALPGYPSVADMHRSELLPPLVFTLLVWAAIITVAFL